MGKISKKERQNEYFKSTTNCPRFLEEKIEEDEIIYQTIVEYCRANNQTFVDGEFPPKLSSWLPIKQFIRKKVEVWWKLTDISYNWCRPTTQLYTFPTVRRVYDGTEYNVVLKQSQWTIYHKLTNGNINQGQIGNCGLVAALALIARHPEILKEIFPRNEISEYGVYQVRLCLYGEWKTIIVDDWFPGKYTVAVCGHYGRELWPSLIEKALAKTYKSYFALTGFSSALAFSIITDSPVTMYLLSHWNDKDEFWRMLKSYASQFLITIGTSKKCKEVVKLTARHAFSLLEVFEEGAIRLVRLRDTPNGKYKWRGDWSEGWSGWPKELKIKLMEKKEKINGSFWISYQDFFKSCEIVHVCKYRPSWSRIRWRMVIGEDGGKKQAMLRISVRQTTTIAVSVFQPGEQIRICFWLSVHNAEEDGELGEPVDELHVARMSSEDVKLRPGEYYVIIAKAFGGLHPANVVLYSSLPISMKLVNLHDEHVLESFQKHVMKYGNIVPVTKENLRIKQILKYEKYMLIMVENYSKDEYLHFDLNLGGYGRKVLPPCVERCQKNRNVQSIPPMSRRIVDIRVEPKRNQVKLTFEYWFSSELQNAWNLGYGLYRSTPIYEELEE